MKFIAALLLVSSGAFAQLPNISGSWTILANSQGGAVQATAEFNQAGGSLSGQVSFTGNACLGSGNFTGSLSGNGGLSISFNSSSGPVTFSGTINVNGNSASGSYSTPSNGCTQGASGTWTATRVAPLLTIAQVVDGASWETEFQIVSLATTSVTYSFQFWGDNGSPMALPIVNGTAGVVSGSLSVGRSAFVQTPGTAASLLEGWASVTSNGPIGVVAIFRQRVTGRPDSEGTVVGAQSGSSVFMPFDNTNSYLTGVAIGNTNTLQTLAVTMQFTAADGTVTMGSLSLPPSSHTAFQISTMFPQLGGVEGTVKFSAPTSDITVVGLRFSPTNSFTSVGVFQPAAN